MMDAIRATSPLANRSWASTAGQLSIKGQDIPTAPRRFDKRNSRRGLRESLRRRFETMSGDRRGSANYASNVQSGLTQILTAHRSRNPVNRRTHMIKNSRQQSEVEPVAWIIRGPHRVFYLARQSMVYDLISATLVTGFSGRSAISFRQQDFAAAWRAMMEFAGTGNSGNFIPSRLIEMRIRRGR
jgi:hypothetical protein